jgi:hypothetical protein
MTLPLHGGTLGISINDTVPSAGAKRENIQQEK